MRYPRHSSPYLREPINTRLAARARNMSRNTMHARILPFVLVVALGVEALENRWLAGARSLVQHCQGYGWRQLSECARRRAWKAIDEILEDDVIPVVDGLELVKLRFEKDGRESVEQSANASVTFDIRKVLQRIRGRGEPEEDNRGLHEKLSNRLARLLRTHVIKIDIERLRLTMPDATTAPAGRSPDAQVEPRGRRRRRRQMQMMPIIMMGVLLMGTVLIPMGFQFLAVLGGKALILAKMALMLSSIQGLKKVATNGVNYGLYHSPVPEPWHERSTGSALHYEIPYAGAGADMHHHHHHAATSSGSSYLDGLGHHFASRSAVQPT